jgi:hypothetical protein
MVPQYLFIEKMVKASGDSTGTGVKNAKFE